MSYRKYIILIQKLNFDISKFLSSSQKDIAKVRTEIEKHLKTSGESNEATETLQKLARSLTTNAMEANGIASAESTDETEKLTNGNSIANSDIISNDAVITTVITSSTNEQQKPASVVSS